MRLIRICEIIKGGEKMKPELYIKLTGKDDEFELSSKIPQLSFLGCTDTPIQTNSYGDFNGVDGSLFYYSNTSRNTITAKFLLKFKDYYQYKALRQEIYRLFMQKHLYRIRTDAEKTLVNYVIPTSFEIEPFEAFANFSQITIVFDNPSGYKFSRYRSDEQTDIWDEYPLGWHIPIFTEESFKFKEDGFQVFNPSDVSIDPYLKKHDLKIKMKFKGTNVYLENTTNGSNWGFNGQLTRDDIVILDGINTYLNGNPASGQTNFGNLVLDQGWNEISVTGATEIEIIFSFPFIYID